MTGLRRLMVGGLALIVAGYCFGIGLIILLSARVPSAMDPSYPPLQAGSALVVFYFDDPPLRRQRVEAGVALLARSRDSTLVMVGGFRPGRDGYIGAEVMRQDAISLGADPARVLADRGSNDSRSNVEGALATLSRAGQTPTALVFVSDRLHLIRLKTLYGTTDYAQPVSLAAGPDPASWLAWFKRLNHEIMAWPTLLLPRAWLSAILSSTRRL